MSGARTTGRAGRRRLRRVHKDSKPPVVGEGYLQVSALHRIRYREYGNAAGIPLILLHGGPALGIIEREVSAYDRRYFRIIAFDQRGAGKSEPPGETRENTTQDLIGDISKLRDFLNIRNFILAGGSWGATLALLYAERHPENIRGLVLRATYLNRREDMDWMYGPGGVRAIYPERWADFVACIPENEGGDTIAAYNRLLNSPDVEKRNEAAATWDEWPPATADMPPTRRLFGNDEELRRHLDYCKVSIHYWSNRLFMKENEILNNIGRIAKIPIEMVHGADDMVVRPDCSIAIQRAHPNARLTLVEGASHSIQDPALFRALSQTTERLGSRLAVMKITWR